MYICICNALRDRDIAHAVQAGATTVDEAYAACGAATACGCCRPEAEEHIAALMGSRGRGGEESVAA